MDRELRLLDLVRKDWWVLVIVLCIIWAIECRLEGNSVIETIEAPLLVVAWGGLIFLLDRWVISRTDARTVDLARGFSFCRDIGRRLRQRTTNLKFEDAPEPNHPLLGVGWSIGICGGRRHSDHHGAQIRDCWPISRHRDIRPTVDGSVRDRLPAGLGDPEMHDLRLAQADGVPLCDRPAGANQVLQHFKCVAARHHSRQREAAGRRGQHP
jgi:hypothetical protein